MSSGQGFEDPLNSFRGQVGELDHPGCPATSVVFCPWPHLACHIQGAKEVSLLPESFGIKNLQLPWEREGHPENLRHLPGASFLTPQAPAWSLPESFLSSPHTLEVHMAQSQITTLMLILIVNALPIVQAYY